MDYTPEDLQHLPQDALDYLSKFISETVHYDFRHTNHIHNESQRKALYRENNTRKEDIYRTIQRTTFDTLHDELHSQATSVDYEDMLNQALDSMGTLLTDGPEYPSPYCFCLTRENEDLVLDIESRKEITKDIGNALTASKRDKRRRRYTGYHL